MIAPLKIPFARVGIGEGAGEANDKSLSQSSAEFAKSVQWVQREAAKGLTKVALVHLALRGFRANDLRGFELALTATSAMEELYRIETWQTRVSVMADLKDLGWFPKEWIVTHFTDLSPDEIEELKEAESTAAGGGSGGGIPGGLEAGAEGSPDDVLGEPGGMAPEGEEGDDTPLGQPPPPPGTPPAEGRLRGYDMNAERRLLQEYKRQGDMKSAMRLVRRWSDRMGRGVSSEAVMESGFEHMLSSKELDGLSRDCPDSEGDMPYDPNSDGGLLVEWSVEQRVRESAITEARAALIEDVSEVVDVDDDEVTFRDVP